MFISILYMFRAAMCPSSGELIVSIRRLVYVSVYRWPFGLQVWMRLLSHPNLHTKRSSIQSDIYQMSYWYNFSWWLGHGCPKHVENRNKSIHEKRNCASSWLFTKTRLIVSFSLLVEFLKYPYCILFPNLKLRSCLLLQTFSTKNFNKHIRSSHIQITWIR